MSLNFIIIFKTHFQHTPARHNISSHKRQIEERTLSTPLPPPQTRKSLTQTKAHAAQVLKPSTTPCSPAQPSTPWDAWGRYHGGQQPSSDDSFHSLTIIPPSALDKPSIVKRYHRRQTTRWGVTACSLTMVMLQDTQFVKCWWWNDSWTVKTVVTWQSASMIPAPGIALPTGSSGNGRSTAGDSGFLAYLPDSKLIIRGSFSPV